MPTCCNNRPIGATTVKTVPLPPITREQADAEPSTERLQFPAPRAYPQNRAAITAVYDGFTVTFELLDTGVGKVEQFISTLIERGYTPAALPATPAKGQNGNGHTPA